LPQTTNEGDVNIRPARSYYASNIHNSASTSSYEEDLNVSQQSRSYPSASGQPQHKATISDQEYWESELQAQVEAAQHLQGRNLTTSPTHSHDIALSLPAISVAPLPRALKATHQLPRSGHTINPPSDADVISQDSYNVLNHAYLGPDASCTEGLDPTTQDSEYVGAHGTTEEEHTPTPLPLPIRKGKGIAKREIPSSPRRACELVSGVVGQAVGYGTTALLSPHTGKPLASIVGNVAGQVVNKTIKQHLCSNFSNQDFATTSENPERPNNFGQGDNTQVSENETLKDDLNLGLPHSNIQDFNPKLDMQNHDPTEETNLEKPPSFTQKFGYPSHSQGSHELPLSKGATLSHRDLHMRHRREK